MAGNSHPQHPKVDQVPILVGIIGHRDIPEADHPELEKKLRSVFASLRKSYPNTTIYALTALAEGADSIGARAAMAENVPIIAPLPMVADDYKKTFSSPGKASELDHFMTQSMCMVMPSHSGKEDTIDHQFARAGAAVVQYSHIVIALWNGQDSGLEAGTSYLIRHAIKGIPMDLVYDLEGSYPSPLDPIATAMVRQLPVTRTSNPGFSEIGDFGDDVDPGKFDELEFTRSDKPKLRLTHSQKRMFDHFESFNRDICKWRPASGTWVDAAIKEAKGKFHPLIEQGENVELPKGLEVLRERFAMADCLASHYQKRRHWRITRYVVVLAALIAFVHQIIGSNLPVAELLSPPAGWASSLPGNDLLDYEKNWPFIGYALLLMFAYGVVFYARLRRWQARYLDYRTIAEGARIQFFWLIAGIRTPVVNFFLRKQRDELEWIRGVLRMWYLRAVVDGGVIRDAHPDQAALIEKHWIRDQRRYSNKTALRASVIDGTLSVLAMLFLGILVVTMITKPFLSKADIEHFLVLGTATAGALVLLVSSLRYFLGYREIHKANTRMMVLFSDADKFYDPTDGIQDDERAILEDLGREALTETGDWLLSNRNRKVNLPKAS
ncbi:MAG: hypothetical protein AAGH89_07685 [Verrucomicrobiota bacterium]